MSITRRTVLEHLAVASDATARETTTIEALAATLDADEHAIEAHLHGLEACDLARVTADGNARVTITGEELLELDVDEMIVVDSSANDAEK
ncbi:hypothetical protein [Halobellus sp. GM3]|uniref:hypothetical protein n=1 Tax=Halobellus sp. GM3 TaxID=3458410 RepID=UPI00403E0775